MTARERAKRIYSWSLNRGHLDAIDRGEREILAAEREAVEAFCRHLSQEQGMRVDLLLASAGRWLRARVEG